MEKGNNGDKNHEAVYKENAAEEAMSVRVSGNDI